MEFLKKNASALVWCVVELILGILLIVNSAEFIRVLAIIVGAIMIVGGVILTVMYFVTHAREAEGKYLFNGLAYIAIGVILCVKSEWLSMLISVILLLLAVILIMDACQKIQETCDKLRLKQKKWIAPLIGAVIEIVLAVLLFALDNTQEWFFITLGILIIVEAVYNFMVIVFLGRVHSAVKGEIEKLNDESDNSDGGDGGNGGDDKTIDI